jgi:hypothetical protein
MSCIVLLSDVIVAIAHYAFRTSEYPVILSLEVHCTLTQQKVMATIMKREFGRYLVLPGEFGGSSKLPTLHQLRKRILLKGKRPCTLDVMLDDNRSVAEEDEDDVMDSMSIADDQKQEFKAIHDNKKQAVAANGQVVSTQKDLGDLLFFAGMNSKKLKNGGSYSIGLPMDVILSTNECVVYDDVANEEKSQDVLLRNRDTLRYVFFM